MESRRPFQSKVAAGTSTTTALQNRSPVGVLALTSANVTQPRGLSAGKRPLNFAKVAITELGMPDMDGCQVVRMIKADSPNPPIIMVTGEAR